MRLFMINTLNIMTWITYGCKEGDKVGCAVIFKEKVYLRQLPDKSLIYSDEIAAISFH